MSDPLAAELARALSEAQQRYRTRRGFGAYVTPSIPPGVIEEFAAALVPTIRQAAADELAVYKREVADDHRERLVRMAAEQVNHIVKHRPREEE